MNNLHLYRCAFYENSKCSNFFIEIQSQLIENNNIHFSNMLQPRLRRVKITVHERRKLLNACDLLMWYRLMMTRSHSHVTYAMPFPFTK